MNTRHFRLGEIYLGAYGDGAIPSDPGAVECPAPEDARQIWGGGAWAPIPPEVPARITRRQGRLALLQAGHLADVETAIAEIADPVERMAAQIEYEAETWERHNPWIERTGQIIGLSPEAIDALFIAAAGY